MLLPQHCLVSAGGMFNIANRQQVVCSNPPWSATVAVGWAAVAHRLATRRAAIVDDRW
jgi:hypothetical protein